MSGPGKMCLQRESLPAAVSLLAGREIVEEEALCLNVRGRLEHCDRCSLACHAGALVLSPDALEVNREKCTGCGACVPACPAGALRLTGFSPARFLETLEGGTEVHLHCTESEDDGGGMVVPCFKVLDERLLAAAAAGGVEVVHLHGLDRCQTCHHGGAMRQVARMRLRLKRWLDGEAPQLRPATGAVATGDGVRRRQDQPPLSRRAFLRFTGAGAIQEASRWLVPVVEEDEVPVLPFFQGDPDEYRQAHPYQVQLAQRADQVPWKEGVELPWRLRSLAQHCTACLTCGRRCPTGALQAKESGKSLGITFELALCTDCGLCEALCPVGALTTHPVRLFEEVAAPRHLLMMLRQRDCEQCGLPFLPEEPGAIVCPTCSNESDLDEEWMAMLGG